MDRRRERMHHGEALVAVRAARRPLTVKERIMASRVEHARRAEIKWDAQGVYLEKCSELAHRVGKNPGEVWEEFLERSACRVYGGNLPVERAEELAFGDVLERFEVKL
jgi:hypothetical protein